MMMADGKLVSMQTVRINDAASGSVSTFQKLDVRRLRGSILRLCRPLARQKYLEMFSGKTQKVGHHIIFIILASTSASVPTTTHYGVLEYSSTQYALRNTANQNADSVMPSADPPTTGTPGRFKPLIHISAKKKKTQWWQSRQSIPPLQDDVLSALNDERLEFPINEACESLL